MRKNSDEVPQMKVVVLYTDSSPDLWMILQLMVTF